MQQFRFTPNALSGPCPTRPAERPRRDQTTSDQTKPEQYPARRPKSRVLPQARIPQTTL